MTKAQPTDSLLSLVDRIPAFSRSVIRVMHLASDLNCNARDLLDVVSSDPVLAMKVLRLVNSAYFGRTQKVTTLHQAMVTLGLNTLKNVALSLAMLGSLPRRSPAGFDIDALWEHSLAVGLAARRLAQRRKVSRSEAETCFVAGLLHDVGKLVLAQFLPTEFDQALRQAREQGLSLYEAELASLGVHHAELGAALARRWELPPALVEALAGHHDTAAVSAAMPGVVFAANQVVLRLGLGSSGDDQLQAFPDTLTLDLGLDAEGAALEMADLPEELERSRILLQL